MANKIDSLKISIDNAEEPKKTKTSPSSPVKKTSNKRGGGMMSLLISILVTALVVGGIFYAWKDKEVEKGLKDISQDARLTREEFEKRIENLKSKVTGMETENLELKTSKEQLEKKVSYLNGATKQYKNDVIGVSFLYPAVFGEIVIKADESASSTKFVATFSENDKLIFGSVSTDYFAADASKPLPLFDNFGFEEKKDKTVYKSAIKDGESEIEINPAKKLSTKNSNAVLVDKKSFPNNPGRPQIDLGENIGAVVNLKNAKNKSLVFINSDLSLMTLIDFESMITTVESK
jgi:hypothetical protein